MRFKILLSYDGTGYAGWQVQAGNHKTIQGTIEAALFKITGKKITVHGSGRTDAGVHAYGQTAHFDLDKDPGDILHRLNCVLPGEIRVLSCGLTNNDFHSRRDAISKTYIYYLCQNKDKVPPWLRNFVWSCGPLNIALIDNIMQEFVGEHDFSSFKNSGTYTKTSIRSIYEIKLEKNCFSDFFPANHGLVSIKITASGFLKQMARNITGFLVYASRDRVSPAALDKIFAARDRMALPTPTAPARGLFLAKVNYGEIF